MSRTDTFDPVVMVKMLLVGYLFGNTSERRLCEEVGMQCIAAGLVGGRQLSADGTYVEANASMDSMTPVVVDVAPKEYLQQWPSRLGSLPPRKTSKGSSST